MLGLFYRSPSQSAAERDLYYTEVDQNIKKVIKVKSDILVFGGDFNSRSQHWWLEDINTVEGNSLYKISVIDTLYLN
jgi:hypothetical protein